MIVRGKMSSQTIIDYHAPFDRGFKVSVDLEDIALNSNPLEGAE